eukprot:357329-Chlamydomonas_euryale.AAC.3
MSRPVCRSECVVWKRATVAVTFAPLPGESVGPISTPGFYAFPTKSLPCKLPWHAGLRGEQRARPRFLRPPLPPPRLRVKVAAVGSWRGARQRLHAACHGHPLAIDHGARGLCLAAVHGPKFGHLASLQTTAAGQRLRRQGRAGAGRTCIPKLEASCQPAGDGRGIKAAGRTGGKGPGGGGDGGKV